MLCRQDVIKDIFHWHGQDSIYVTNTGFISRDVYNLFPNNKNGNLSGYSVPDCSKKLDFHSSILSNVSFLVKS